MLGLRSQYALSTFFIAEMRQNLHFTYVQDDIRVNDKLTLNAGLRYEYASPMWEANNALTNFDPVNKVDDARPRTDRSPIERWSIPTGTTSARGSDLRTRVAPKTVVRGGWGTSYVHINRIGSANLLGDQRSAGRARRGRAGRCDRGVVPADRAGLSGGPDRSVDVQSADGAHQLHPEGLPLEPGAELVPVVCSASSDRAC